ncbi:18312_t:CDS:1, partial [Racocetra fulgida]
LKNYYLNAPMLPNTTKMHSFKSIPGIALIAMAPKNSDTNE